MSEPSETVRPGVGVPGPPVRRRVAITTAQTLTGEVAWGVASEGYAYGERFDAAKGAQVGLLAAFAHVVTSDWFAGRPVDLLCADRVFVNAVASQADSWPHASMTHVSDANGIIGLALRAACEALGQKRDDVAEVRKQAEIEAAFALVAAEEETRKHLSVAPPVVVATDGSARGGGYDVVGYGWVADNGLFGQGIAFGSTLIAELSAIAHVLRRFEFDQRLVVLVDSREALRRVREFQASRDANLVQRLRHEVHDRERFTKTGAKRRDSGVVSLEGVISLMERMAYDLYVRRDVVSFRWVKGHAGHALNEGADRLAVQARRSFEFDVPIALAKKTAKEIAEESVALYGQQSV